MRQQAITWAYVDQNFVSPYGVTRPQWFTILHVPTLDNIDNLIDGAVSRDEQHQGQLIRFVVADGVGSHAAEMLCYHCQ